MLIAILAAALHAVPPRASRDSTCIDVRLAANSVDNVDLGGHRYDQPEHIRELRVPPARDRPHFWLLDTYVDGLERYDTISLSMTPDPEGSYEDFVPLQKIDWIPGDPARMVRLCW